MPPAPLTFEARVRHLLHVLLDQAALRAHLAAQVTLHTLPGYGDTQVRGPLASGGAWAQARPQPGPPEPRTPPEPRGLRRRSPS